MAEQPKIPFAKGISDHIELMNGISHSDKEIFLWEFVLKAAQALYEMRIETFYECDVIGPRGLFIDIIPDKSNHTLSIVDNGFGKTEDDLKNQLFSVSEPTLNQKRALKRRMNDARLLKDKKVAVDEFYTLFSGYRIGFFAAFMVADNVEITTKRYGTNDKPCRLFASAKDKSFFIVGGDDTTISSIPRGTKVTLHLKEDQFEYLDVGRLKGLIDKYTFDQIPYPISICSPSGDIIEQRLADVEEKMKDMNELKREFEGLRTLFVDVLFGRNAYSKYAVIISDRLSDVPAVVSLDKATIEINPRHREIKKLRQDHMNNPEDKYLLKKIKEIYVCGEVLIFLYQNKHRTKHLPQMAEEPPEKKQKMAEQTKIPFAKGVSELLLILMNGISHGNKEVFLREFVFKAAQALYKMRLATLHECDVIGPRGLFIDIIPDESNHTLSIVDNGIGMTEDDLKKLFTVPEPALERYMQAARHLQNSGVAVDEFYTLNNSNFHLGFFAAFIVADKVEITTKRYGDDKPCMLFASARDMSFLMVRGDYSSDTIISSTPRGTKVTLHLNQDSFDYLDEGSLKGLIDKYTFDLVPYPISIQRPHIDEEMEKLKSDFEGLRKLFVEVLSGRNAHFKHAVISDRMYDLPAFVSLDRATIEINPRDSLIKKLRQDAMNNPEDMNLLETINELYLSGAEQSARSKAVMGGGRNYPGHTRLDTFHQGRPYLIGQDVHPSHPSFSSSEDRLPRYIQVAPAGESSVRPTCRPESSVAPEEYETDQYEADPPVSIPGSEEDAHISQSGSSTPDASILASEHTRDSRALDTLSCGPTSCLKKRQFKGKRIIIHADVTGEPVGSVDILKLFSFLDTLTRDGNKAPLNYSKWKDMPQVFKENMWKEIEEKFYFDHPGTKYWIMRHLCTSWNTWKANPDKKLPDKLERLNKQR